MLPRTDRSNKCDAYRLQYRIQNENGSAGRKRIGDVSFSKFSPSDAKLLTDHWDSAFKSLATILFRQRNIKFANRWSTLLKIYIPSDIHKRGHTHTLARTSITSSRIFLISVCFCHVISIDLRISFDIDDRNPYSKSADKLNNNNKKTRIKRNAHIDQSAFVIRIMVTMGKLLKNLCLYLIAHSIAIAKQFFFRCYFFRQFI